MANLIKKIRTNKGDLPIDYNALENKPTIASLGGVAKAGDTMTGSLIINDGEKSSALGLQAPANSEGKQAYARVYKNASATADYGLQLRDYAHGGNETENSSMLTICSSKSALADKIYFTNQVNGVSTNYNLYGEHNKPTLSTLGVTATASELNRLDGLTATTAELNYCDGVTSNIQTQLDGKAASSHGTHVTFTTATPKSAGTADAGSATTVSRSDHVHPVQTTVSGNAGSATVLKTARTIRTNLASTDTASFDGSANVAPGVTGILPIANGGTGATTVADIRTNLGNLGKVWRSNPAQDKSVASGDTPVTLAYLDLPAGTYITTGNHVWASHTTGAIYDDSIRVDDSRIFCYVRNLMDNGGGAACCAIIQLEEDTRVLYTTRQLTGKAHSVHDVHFYAIKIT